MSTPKWTPGPWHRNIPPAKQYPTVWSGRSKHVAYVKVDNQTADEAEANINLIAAAPELDEACDPDTLDRAADYFGDSDNGFALAFVDRLRKLAKLQRSAKAKARGEATPS